MGVYLVIDGIFLTLLFLPQLRNYTSRVTPRDKLSQGRSHGKWW